MFSSVLIANRGEIACRIARTARRLGLRVIAVHSEADRNALHVRSADEAYEIGPAPARESYLAMDRILDVAGRAKADCIHPGYGFLSENPAFAEACAAAGIVFVGPPASAIRAMGHKDAAKRLMIAADVPVVPGYQGEAQDLATLESAAGEAGYPVMIKAVAGGGGKGMRKVEIGADFGGALDSCRREAAAAFGDDRVLIEKFIENPRHIEMQVIGDNHGNCIHLFERDCSLQRRHQKVIEEAAAPGMRAEIREEMGRAAVSAATAVGYSGAGTVEFIASPDGRFYFMEMNTRLQVEHPVTEMITGLDLVEMQFRVASGERLAIAQNDVAINGHAIEARLYAENPEAGFLPQTGTLHVVKWPAARPGLRIDTGVEQGAEISPYYDPMIAKVIVHAGTRDEACDGLRATLDNTVILGLRTNLGFLAAILGHPQFRAGDISTGFIDTHLSELISATSSDNLAFAAAAAWVGREKTGPPWSLSGLPRKDFHYVTIDEVSYVIESDASGILDLSRENIRLAARNAAAPDAAHFDTATQTLFITLHGRHAAIRADDLLARPPAAADGAASVRAPMPGRVARIMVTAGDAIAAGQPLLVLEAMKMEHTLKAGIAGTVAQLSVTAGAQVKEGDILCVIEAPAAA
ncbi:acetyl/propionyl/methylcrotonyl-CoA carboxylase subunit alpha [soil metagenome]